VHHVCQNMVFRLKGPSRKKVSRITTKPWRWLVESKSDGSANYPRGKFEVVLMHEAKEKAF
jgi:hypothetical protein